MKFLIPFSLFVAAGQQLALWALPALDVPAVPAGLRAIGQPFSGWAIEASAVSSSDTPVAAGGLLPLVSATLWLAGAVVMVGVRAAQRRRIAAVAAQSPVLSSGREADALARVFARTGMRRRVTIRDSAETIGPGVLGFLRPVLLWPRGLSSRLTDAGIEAIISHELSHVRRADNLSSLLHVVVETLFWYHPLVWWLGARLVEDRERACDRAALALGAHPHTYAESLLNVCRFSLRSPQPALTGITSSDLSQRVEAIMAYRFEHSLDTTRRILIVASAALIVAGPLAAGAMTASPSQRPEPTPAVELPVPMPVPIEVEAPTAVPVLATPAVAAAPVAVEVPTVVPATPQRPTPVAVRPAVRPVNPPQGAAARPTDPQLARPHVEHATTTSVRPVALPSASLSAPRPQQAAQTPPRDPAPVPRTEADEIEEFRRGALSTRTPGLRSPSILREVKPVYTREAMEQKIQGTVELELVIAADGTVDRARVVQGLDPVHGLDEAALTAARSWLFRPATLDGEPVAVWAALILDFRIGD
jgi:TonB family protein